MKRKNYEGRSGKSQSRIIYYPAFCPLTALLQFYCSVTLYPVSPHHLPREWPFFSKRYSSSFTVRLLHLRRDTWRQANKIFGPRFSPLPKIEIPRKNHEDLALIRDEIIVSTDSLQNGIISSHPVAMEMKFERDRCSCPLIPLPLHTLPSWSAHFSIIRHCRLSVSRTTPCLLPRLVKTRLSRFRN